MKKISIALFTHPLRKTQLKKTLKSLKSSDITIIKDNGVNSIWETAKRAWLAYDKDATHHLVLQDDITACKNFLPALPHILKNMPDDACFSFCDNIKYMKEAYDNSHRWLLSNKVTHAQGLAIPTSIIHDWIDWSDWHVREEYYHDDGRLEMFLIKHKIYIYHTIPSLLHHKDEGSVKRKIRQLSTPEDISKKDFEPYMESIFAGEDFDPFTVDWSLPENIIKSLRRQLNITQKWAIGEAYISPEEARDVSPIINKTTTAMPYKDAIIRDRKKRGLI